MKNATTCYNKPPSPQDITDHLAANIGGLNNVYVVDLQQAIPKWWREDPRVPEYINRLKDGQEKAVRASVLISNEWLTATATSSILEKNSLTTVRDKWDEILIADKKWTKWKWKNHFINAQVATKRAT